MAEIVTAKDIKKGFTFTKSGRGNHRARFVIVSVHRDKTVSYAPDRQFVSLENAVRIPVDEFLKDIFGRQVESRKDKMARERAEAKEIAARIERTKASHFTAVLMDFLIDAKAGKDIDAITERLETFVKEEKETAHEEGYDKGYESHREEYSYSRW